ncbi:MFS transporter [Neobacillus niacini]|uniref:MFS transporter n=1 Tax=Neobacillus niacini TaxID=86668 RepID=UPI002FFD88FF
MGKKEKVKNPNKIGALRFWAWQSRALSAGCNFLVLGFITIYCTDALNMPAVLVGTLLMTSKIFDGVTDLFAGYLIDKTKNTRWGKARPYELAILGVWLCTWLLFSTPGDASLVMKSIWVFVMYSCVNAIFITLLSANNNAYMVRAFSTQDQMVKIASFGGVIITVGAMVVNISFPILMGTLATSPQGWSTMVAIYAIPLAIIGIFRFLFVKETNLVDVAASEKITMKDVITVLKSNPYIYIICIMQFVSSLVTNMGIATYFYTYVVGNVASMSVVMAFSIVVLPLLFFMPMFLKKFQMGKIILVACGFSVVGGVATFLAGGNMQIIIIASIIGGIGSLPIAYLTDLMLIDCGSYNESKGLSRMDGTLGAVKGFTNKLGAAAGAGLMGLLLSMSGYDGSLTVQPESAILMIRLLIGVIPAALFLIVGIAMFFYKLDKLMPQINKDIEAKRAAFLAGEAKLSGAFPSDKLNF